MFYQQLYDLLHREPFQPFRVVLKDGRVFEVRYPRINLLGRHHITLGIPLPDDPHPTLPVCRDDEMVEFWQIDRIEAAPLPVASARG